MQPDCLLTPGQLELSPACAQAASVCGETAVFYQNAGGTVLPYCESKTCCGTDQGLAVEDTVLCLSPPYFTICYHFLHPATEILHGPL